jgi:hypothetical protein
MRKLLTAIFVFTLFLEVNGQLSKLKISPSELYVHADTIGLIDTAKVYFNYSGVDSVAVFWKVDFGSNFPKKWISQICDKQLCYNYNSRQQSKNKPNWIAKDQVFFSFYLIDSFDFEFKDTLQWEFYSDKEFTNLIQKVPIYLGSSAPVSTKNETAPIVSVFPTSVNVGSHIQILSEEKFSTSLFSIDNKKFEMTKIQDHLYQLPYDISKGIYFLKINFLQSSKTVKLIVH